MPTRTQLLSALDADNARMAQQEQSLREALADLRGALKAIELHDRDRARELAEHAAAVLR